MRYNTKIVYKKPIAAILFSVIMVLSIFSGVALADKVGLPDKGVVLADKLGRSNEIPEDYTLSSVPISREYTATLGDADEVIAYDRAGAYNYARKYWDEVCSDGYFWDSPSGYVTLSSGTNIVDRTGYDCAHFVSCCIGSEPNEQGGGLDVPSRVPPTYGEPGAERLGNWLLSSGLAEQKTSIDQLEKGDVINYDWDGDGHWNHVALYLGDGKVAAHTTCVWNEPWQLGTTNHRLIHIKSAYSLDLIFTIDTTGSMWDDIDYVKASASAIVDEILLDIPTARIAVVDYRDFSVYPYGGAGDYPFHDVLSFSTDKPTIVAAIQGLTLGWGADWRESVYSGLMHSIDSTSLGGWRGSDQAAKVIILMGDAPPHDPEPFTGYTLSSVVTAAYNADPVIIYPIQIGGTVEKFEELADQTGGEAFTAANAGEVVDAILEAIGEIKTKPVAVANGPYSGYVGSPITFDGTGSYDLDGMIVSYEWDLDDDGEFDDATGPTPSKTWSTIYSGTISLLVTDDDGEIDTDSTTLTVEEAEDTTPPTIESVTLDAYTTIPDATIHVTLEATDNVGVTSVTVDGTALVETGSVWEGDITAPSTTGDYTLTIRAEDEAGNFAEATLDYSVVIPTGGLGVAILPKVSSASAGSILPLEIKVISTENFDDVIHVYLTTEGIPASYQADLTWCSWTDTIVQIPAGGEIMLPIEVQIPLGESGPKYFFAKAESTNWNSDAKDWGRVVVTPTP